MPRLDLRTLILLLAIVSALLTFANTFIATYHTQREQLTEQTLEANRAYAVKLAEISQQFFLDLQSQLAFSADVLAERYGDEQAMDAEIARLILQNSSFNTALVVNADGRVLASSQDTRYLLGQVLSSVGARQALSRREPLVSPTYIGANEQLLVLVSAPIFNRQGDYLGYVGGAIYLQRQNVLHSLLGVHYHRDGSYIYVVDGQGQLIYHEDTERIGQDVSANPVVQKVIAGGEGAQRVVNTRGIEMLAGYAHVPAAQWGVVAQRPLADTLSELDGLVWSSMLHAVPFTLASLLVFWWLATLIARPLRELSAIAKSMDNADAPARIEEVPGWYYEAKRLRKAMLGGVRLLHQKVGQLSQENATDPLTGLTNRRGLQLCLDTWHAEGRAFAVLALDIDHFKRINDTFGHDTGDAVLQFFAQQMRRCARTSDLLCRSGGEEFIMLLPEVSYEEALRIAQRLCDHVAATASPTGEPITISIGIARHPDQATSVAGVLKEADQALYAAKRTGRNRVVGAASMARVTSLT